MKVFFFLNKKLVKAVLGHFKITMWGQQQRRVSYVLLERVSGEILQLEIQVCTQAGHFLHTEETRSETSASSAGKLGSPMIDLLLPSLVFSVKVGKT